MHINILEAYKFYELNSLDNIRLVINIINRFCDMLNINMSLLQKSTKISKTSAIIFANIRKYWVKIYKDV